MIVLNFVVNVENYIAGLTPLRLELLSPDNKKYPFVDLAIWLNVVGRDGGTMTGVLRKLLRKLTRP